MSEVQIESDSAALIRICLSHSMGVGLAIATLFSHIGFEYLVIIYMTRTQ